MDQDTASVRRDFDAIALLSVDYPENDRYQQWLLQHVPETCEHALDIGCGTGFLSRALAERAATVHGIDLSPNMVRLARHSSSNHSNIQFTVGDFMSQELPLKHFDCIALVAVLHHLPWESAVGRAKELLRNGGVLLIVDLLRDDGITDYLLSGIAWTLRLFKRREHRQSRDLRATWEKHGRGESYPTLSEIRRICDKVLPGAQVRRHLYWRYSVVWTNVA